MENGPPGSQRRKHPGGIDQRDEREGLREISHEVTRLRVPPLGKQARIVPSPQKLLQGVDAHAKFHPHRHFPLEEARDTHDVREAAW